MSHEVKPQAVRGLQAARIARTEKAILDAAQDLFADQGYVPTTLAQIAERAGVATRTVFVRFGSKSTLFRRVIDRALAGDDQPIDLAHRPATSQAMSAPTFPQRLDALVELTVGIMERTAALFDVAAQAEGLEPELASAWQAGRRATADLARTFWQRATTDNLLPMQTDPELLAITTDVLICADTMVHLRRTREWTAKDHSAWLKTSLHALAYGPPRGRPTNPSPKRRRAQPARATPHSTGTFGSNR
jgi:AcrR family transcriptional regulator